MKTCPILLYNSLDQTFEGTLHYQLVWEARKYTAFNCFIEVMVDAGVELWLCPELLSSDKYIDTQAAIEQDQNLSPGDVTVKGEILIEVKSKQQAA